MNLKNAPQKMQFIGIRKKLSSLVPWRHNAKWWENSTESTVTSSRYVWIQISLDIPQGSEQGRICVRGFMGKIISGEKFLRV